MPAPASFGILLAEDTDDMRFLLTAAFQHSAFRVVAIAEDGDQAQQIWDERHAEIDAVALDHRMPGLEGLEVAAHIRSTNTTVPIVLFSAELTRELIAEADALSVGVMHKDQILALPDHPDLAAVVA